MKSTRKTDNEIYDSAFAKKLRELLESNSLTMTKLAKELGVKQQTVSQWADGSTRPDLKHLKPLASYFKISIDELVTGVAFDNEGFHLNTGLSNLAIEKLKELKNVDNYKNKIIIEFLNVIIENMDSKVFNLSRLARQCMDYIVGAHEPILEQEKLIERAKDGWEILVHVDRPNMRNDDLDFKTYQLTKYFEYLIEHLTKNPKIAERARKVYKDGNLRLPDYSDSRFNSKPDPQ